MWSPTHIEITVSRARNLKAKGKSGTNDAYVTIKHGKEKFQTTLRERSRNPEWHEQCQFPLSEESNVVKLKVYHRNLIGKDDFLGYTEIPLDWSLVYERPKSKWYNLGNKPGDKGPEKNRGEIEVIVTYVVESISGSQMNLNMTKKRTLFKGITHQFEKMNIKGSLKRNQGQFSGSNNDLRNIESTSDQSCRTLPLYYKGNAELVKSGEESISGSVEEENEEEFDHELLKDEKAPRKGLGFKFPFKPKNKRLQKMSLLSQSTLGIPSLRPFGRDIGHMQNVTNPPSESSSGFGSRRVSGSESQSSSCDGSIQLTKETDLPAPDKRPSLSETSEGSCVTRLGEPEELKLEVKDDGWQDQDKAAAAAAGGSLAGWEDEASVAEDVGVKTGHLFDAEASFLPVAEDENISEKEEDKDLGDGINNMTPKRQISLETTTLTDLVTGSYDFDSDAAVGDHDKKRADFDSEPSRLEQESFISASESKQLKLKPDLKDLLPESTDLQRPAMDSVLPVSSINGSKSMTEAVDGSIQSNNQTPKPAHTESNSKPVKVESLDLIPETLSDRDSSKSDAVLLKQSMSRKKQLSVDSGLDSSQLFSDQVAEKKGSADTVDVLAGHNNLDKSRKKKLAPLAPRRESDIPGSLTAEYDNEFSKKHIDSSQEPTAEDKTTDVTTPSGPTLLLPEDILRQFQYYSRDDLIRTVLDQQKQLRDKDAHIHDLENYIDDLLVKIIDIQPQCLSANEKHSTSSGASRSISQQPGVAKTSSEILPTPNSYVAFKNIIPATSSSSHVTMVTSPKGEAPKKPMFANPFKGK